MELVPDDLANRVRKVWLGPEGHRWIVTWTYPEWLVFAVTAATTGAVTLVGLNAAIGSDDWLLVIDLIVAVAMGASVGALCRMAFHPALDADQTLGYVLRQVHRGAAALAWSRGPVDWVVVGLAAGAWVPVMILTPGPWLLRAPLVAFVASRLARYLVHRAESPQRRWARLMARAERQAVPVAFESRVQIPALRQIEQVRP